MYRILLERTAEHDLKKLSPSDFHRIIPHIKSLAEEPRPTGCRKITNSKNDWRIRVGEYRIIYEIEDREKAVKIILPIRELTATFFQNMSGKILTFTRKSWSCT
ncbi:MAG: type II toxin-antitoxin system RelE/ParE family toxin [Candidatus Wallbacteria bacterium]|nr:type II toxin-antitoxin system RelE/ParE family toxin [Candidatus Wallbacteria bacterium]